MGEEMKMIQKNKTWVLTARPTDEKVYKVKMIVKQSKILIVQSTYSRQDWW